MSGTTDEQEESLRDIVAAHYAELSDDDLSTVETTEEVADGLQGETEGQAEREVTEPEPIDPPTSWSREDKEFFKSLDRRAQEVISRREQERESGIQKKSVEVAQERKRIEQEREQLQGLVKAADAIKQNPTLAVTQILQAYGIDPRQYAQALTQPQQNRQIDPNLLQLQQQVQTLGQYIQQQHTAQLQGAKATAEQTVVGFAQAVGQDGRPLRPYFEDVAEEIEAILPVIKRSKPQANAQEILQEAYDRATWANPSIRNLLTSQAQQNAQVLQDGKQKAERAKLASSSVTGSPGAKASSSEKLPDDLHSTVALLYNRLAAA